jgi:hypothetical protein
MNTEATERRRGHSVRRRKAEEPSNMHLACRNEFAANELSTSGPVGGANRFQTTRWSVLYAFIRHRGHSPEDAQDLAQGFFLHLAERRTLRRVDRSKGKFRSFLLASLQNYLSNEAQRSRCLKRGGKAQFLYLDIEDAEERYGMEPANALTPEKIFDARWAMVLLGEAMNRLSREYLGQGKANAFEALKVYLDPINSKELRPTKMSRVGSKSASVR